MKTIEEQINGMVPEWTKLVKSLKPTIGDDYRATDDPGDDTPAMCLTVGFTQETEDENSSWSYQTGDNSFTGGAYGHPHWAVVTVTRTCKSSDVADEIAEQISELVWQ